MRTLSSSVTGAGLGSYRHFINRHVDKDYAVDNHTEDMLTYIDTLGYDVSDTVGMMTAAKLERVAQRFSTGDCFSIFVVVTAGVSNAVDCTASPTIAPADSPGTINTWIFINGKLTDAALVQAITTATEAKTKAVIDLGITDPETKTIATGTSTDSIVVAATQRGEHLPYAGTATYLGKLIGQTVYTETKRAILQSLEK